jgi:type IV pilus assembly protein PilW
MNYAIKIRATRACYAMSRSKKYQKYRRQAGVTLIELMVGIAIGLMVVAVALGALMVSRGVSGTVSDASNIQQQAAYAMRVIGAQIRQAGSLYINMTYQTNNADPYLAQVAIETSAPASGTYNAFEPSTDTIKGASDSMTIGYRRYKETVTNPANPGQDESQSRNCIGGPANNSDDKRLESIFRYNPATATLSCSGNDPAASPQPIIQNVANFEVHYLLQDNSTQGDSKVKRVLAAGVGADWNKVQGIEVCLVLYGNEAIDLPSGSKYPDCDGELKDIPQTGERARRMHMVFRNVFQLRSQGLT